MPGESSRTFWTYMSNWKIWYAESAQQKRIGPMSSFNASVTVNDGLRVSAFCLRVLSAMHGADMSCAPLRKVSYRSLCPRGEAGRTGSWVARLWR
eukprot:2837349-Rhodomonas_salina.1